ncbi:uncharacterized protein [Erythrolamprus reginae]|uniref:uncharacterized protein n=1 Tax=Erythrolamprus reginae TaxID=121349 RepID=UPI00396C6E20
MSSAEIFWANRQQAKTNSQQPSHGAKPQEKGVNNSLGSNGRAREKFLPKGGPDLKETGSSSWWGQSHQGAGLPEKYISLRPLARIVGFLQHLLATMRRSWLGLQLALSCALLLAVFVADGRCCKEEEKSSEEESPSEKRHHSMEECCEKRCHHHEDECCCERCHHHHEDECCCERCHHHHEDECCCCERCHHHHEDECCCCERCHHHEDECCEKKHSHGKEESGKKRHSHGKKESGKKRHSHGKKESGKKRHSHVEEEKKKETDKKKPVEKKRPKKMFPFPGDLEETSTEMYKSMAEREQSILARAAAQDFDPVYHHRKAQAIAHVNRGSEGSYYKHLEDGHLEYKKAIGVMVYINVLLGKTNCTKTKEQEETGVENSKAPLEKKDCQLPPPLKQEKRNCTFCIFIDVRTGKEAVVSQKCSTIPKVKLYKPFKSPGF